MSSFAAFDLSSLPDPSSIVPLDYATILEERFVELEAQLSKRFGAAEVTERMALARNVAASPSRYLNEAGAARELYVVNLINAAIRSVHLATAHGDDLDIIASNRNVVRRVVDDTDLKNIIYETDDIFRARIQLVIESYSPHGAEGSYVYWALEADGRVLDVVPYGPNHNLDPAIPASHAKLVVLSNIADGVAPSDLLDAVYKNCIPDKRRPVADKLEVISAAPVAYSVEAELHVTSQEAASLVLDVAQPSVEAFVADRRRIGRNLYRTSLAASLGVNGVVDVVITSPPDDVVIGPFEAAYCTGINLTVKQISGGWRDV